VDLDGQIFCSCGWASPPYDGHDYGTSVFHAYDRWEKHVKESGKSVPDESLVDILKSLNEEFEQIMVEIIKVLNTVSGELRHAYVPLNAGRVIRQKQLANGLISPQIGKLERLSALLQNHLDGYLRNQSTKPSPSETDRIDSTPG
jgi:hypothetical protein